MLKHLLDFTLFQNLCRHLSYSPDAAWSVIAMDEKPVLLHTTGLEVAGYVNTYTRRLHFKPHQVRQGSDLYYVEPPSISVHPRRQVSKIAAAPKGFPTRRLELAALDWWANAVAWRTQRAAHQQRTAEYATMLTLIGHGHHLSGYQHPVIVSYGSSNWKATIHDDGTVTLELRRGALWALLKTPPRLSKAYLNFRA